MRTFFSLYFYSEGRKGGEGEKEGEGDFILQVCTHPIHTLIAEIKQK